MNSDQDSQNPLPAQGQHDDRQSDQHEARLQAFLNRDDALSALLRDMPQPEPSSALDAAVLADARAALLPAIDNTEAEAAPKSAANDAVFPGAAQPARLTFLQRWRVPLSAAATVLIALPIAWQQFQAGVGQPQSAYSVAAPAAASPAAAPTDLPARAAEAPSDTLARQSAAAPPVSRPSVSRPSTSRPPPPAPAAAPAALASATPPPASAVAEAAMPKMAPAEERATQLADAPKEISQPSSLPLPPQARHIMPTPMPVPAPTPAPAPATAERRVDTAPLASRLAPRDWLKRIEAQLDQGELETALADWKRFRATYPSYEIPAALQDKLRAAGG